MTSNLIILKLGGSIITAKESGRPVLETRRIKHLAKEVAKWYFVARAQRSTRLILLYGGGSFGHPLAHRYKLQNKVLSERNMVGAGRTILAMRELGNRLADIFLDAGIPVVPLQTSSFVREKQGHVLFEDYSIIETILARGGVPLLGGDVVIADDRQTAIASGDELATALAGHFHARKLLFVTNVNGVYKEFPPRRGERPLPIIRRKELRRLLAPRAAESAHDVTGAMMGKLHALLPLRHCEVKIFSALAPGSLAGALSGGSRGTSILL